MSKRLKLQASLMPSGVLRSSDEDPIKARDERIKRYDAEKKLIKEKFASFGNKINWNAPEVTKQLQAFGEKVIDVVSVYMDLPDMVDMVLPGVNLGLGEEFIEREVHGMNIYYGTYGASVRMSRPQFTEYTVKPNLKQVGIDLVLAQIAAGKYSPSELADYTTGLITAWRNHLLFTTTLGGMSVYQSGGAQYQAGTGLGFPTIDTAIDKITDEGDLGFIVGRRSAIHKLSRSASWSDPDKQAINQAGMAGTYLGMPVMKVNSFTDPEYGTVYPMSSTELWLFSGLPIGRAAYAQRLQSSQETIMRTGRLNMYLGWDDGFGIWRTNRAAVIGAIT